MSFFVILSMCRLRRDIYYSVHVVGLVDLQKDPGYLRLGGSVDLPDRDINNHVGSQKLNAALFPGFTFVLVMHKRSINDGDDAGVV